MSESEIDPQALRAELEQIKDAMGIQERYPTRLRGWLVFGLLVLAASIGSQIVVLRDLPASWHPVVWFVSMGVGGAYMWTSSRKEEWPETGTKPSVPFQFGVVFLLYVVYLLVLGPAFEALGERGESIVIFSLVVALVGVAYLVVGNTLTAYYIRRRDRFAFYVGGAWMLVFAVLMPIVAVLRTWGYAAFGVLFAIHAAGSYVVLSRS